MKVDLERIRERLADYLKEKGVPAQAAWPDEKRKFLTKPVAIVSLRECCTEPAGMMDYLGEQYNENTGLWEECYGRRVKLTFGLDLYAPETGGEELQGTAAALAHALSTGSPEGLAVKEFSCGETEYDGSARLLKRKASVVCSGWLCAVAQADEPFLDFELRGGLKQ